MANHTSTKSTKPTTIAAISGGLGVKLEMCDAGVAHLQLHAEPTGDCSYGRGLRTLRACVVSHPLGPNLFRDRPPATGRRTRSWSSAGSHTAVTGSSRTTG